MSTRRPAYALIVGQGRSGTNWLLDLLDLSRETHCRNEANETRGGAMLSLPDAHFVGTGDAVLERGWDDAIRSAAVRMGERDHGALRPKAYVRELPRRMGLGALVKDRRTRGVLATIVPPLREGEWPVPAWLGSGARLGDALPVFKLAQVPGWAAWVLENRPAAAVLHIVRHPGGFLNSWRHRYLAKQDAASVSRLNRERLARLVEVDPSWSRTMGPIESMSVEESELWYWRYASESIHRAGQGVSGYRLVLYEKLAAEGLGVMRDVYAACGLEFTSEVERGVQGYASESATIADAWHEKLSPEHRAVVTRILEGSPLRDLWGAPA